MDAFGTKKKFNKKKNILLRTKSMGKLSRCHQKQTYKRQFPYIGSGVVQLFYFKILRVSFEHVQQLQNVKKTKKNQKYGNIFFLNNLSDVWI